MKQLSLLLLLAFFNISCETIQSSRDKQTEPIFKIVNSSNFNLDYIKIVVCDKTESGEIDISIFEDNLLVKGKDIIIKKKLKDYSKSGNGYFKVFAKKHGQTDILYQRLLDYREYNFADDSFPGYNAFEIVVFDKNTLPFPNNEKEINGTFIKL